MAQGSRGKDAEDLALAFLEKKQLRLVQRNFHSRYGEIDLIMRDQDKSLVFVEVRYRKSSRYGSGAETVDRKKQTKLITTALYFLQKHPKWQTRPARFDVISIDGMAQNINWIPDAFDVSAT